MVATPSYLPRRSPAKGGCPGLRVRVAVWRARRYAGIEVHFEGGGWAAAARRIYEAARALLEQRSQAWREALSAPRLGAVHRGMLQRYESGEVDWLPPVRLRDVLLLEVGARTAVVAERHVIDELEGAVLEAIRELLPSAEVEVLHLAGRARRPLTRVVLKPSSRTGANQPSSRPASPSAL